MQLILYSKPGCHLCEGLWEKLQQVDLPLIIEMRDITTQDEWFAAYEYEVPVLFLLAPTGEQRLPRLSPRTTMKQWDKQLQTWAKDYNISLDGT